MNEDKFEENVAVKESLPTYRCHKEVRAAKIADIGDGRYGIKGELINGHIVTEGDGSFLVSKEYMLKHNPQVGGYYVRYSDGYESYSPAEAFESGYTRL